MPLVASLSAPPPRRCGVLCLLVTFCSLAVAPAIAVPLSPGESAQGLALLSVDFSTFVVEIGSTDFFDPNGYTGLLLSAVSSTPANPSTGFTFTYQIAHFGPANAASIERVELSGFAGFEVDVGYYFGGVAPAVAYRDASGDKIGFEFFPLAENPATDSLSPDANSAVLLIHSSASGYAMRENAASFDGGLAVATTLTPGSEPDVILGDTNGDQVVDIIDLNNVRNNFNSIGFGDTDGNGAIDIADLNNVRNNFGAGQPASVPEPSTLVLVTIVLVLARRVRRKSEPKAKRQTSY